MIKEKIKRLRKKGYSYEEIAKLDGRSRKLIWKIAKDVRFSGNGEKRYHKEVRGIVRRIKSQKSKLSPVKVRIIAHLLFDGTAYKSRSSYHRVMKYINSSRELVDQFTTDVEKIYGLTPSAFETYLGSKMPYYKVHFLSKEMFQDLSGYFSSYASNSNIGIPNTIMEGDGKIKLEFLKAFWEDEGSISARGRIMADLKNKKIINQLIKIHREFGLPLRLTKYTVHTGEMYKVYLAKTNENLKLFSDLGLFDKAVITHGENVGKKKSEVLRTIIRKRKRHPCFASVRRLTQ